MKNNKILAIDIGGTKIVTLIRTGARLSNKVTIATPKSKTSFLRQAKLWAEYATSKQIKKVGIAIAGQVQGSTLAFGVNLHWLDGLNFSKLFLNSKVSVINDAEAWALAEGKRGDYYKIKNILVFTVGTGVGRASFFNGKHKKSSSFVLVSSWEKQYQKIRDSKNWMELSKFLGNKLSTIINYVKPQVIIFGGGVLNAQNGTFFSKLKQELIKLGVKQPIVKTKFGDSGAAIGASLLFE